MKKIIVLGYIITIILASCDPGDGKLKVINNSNEVIYFNVRRCDDSIKSYPIVKKENTEEIDTLYSNILLSKEKTNSIVMGKWEKRINECKDIAIRIYFFKKELVENVDKETFLKRQAYSKKFILKVKDLEKMNWRVVYDGK